MQNIIIDGVWHEVRVNNDAHAVTNPSTSEVDQIVALLTEIVRRTQGLSEKNAGRVRVLSLVMLCFRVKL